ncbi:cobalamin biosynthesis protein [Kitasatospora sp. NPDC054939]
MIGLVAALPSGRPLADELHAAWPDASTVHRASGGSCFGPREAMELALSRHTRVVCLAPLALAVRLLVEVQPEEWGPDRAVVCADPQRRWAVPLTSGAEELAREVAAVLGATPVLGPGRPAAPAPLDLLHGHAVQVTGGPGGEAVRQALREGRPVRLEAELDHPLPALPPSVTPDAPADAPVLRITDRAYRDDVLLVQPRTLVVGVGAGTAAGDTEVIRLVLDTLAAEGFARNAVARLATVRGKAGHPGVRWAAFCLGVPVVELPAEELAGVPVPTPSDGVRAAVGTASVAEAAAVLAADGGELLVTKRKSAAATVAVARTAVRGRLAVVGLGPGDRDLLVPRAVEELRRASVVVGTPAAVERIADLLRPGTRRVTPDPDAAVPGDAGDPTAAAVALAGRGQAVCLVADGDGTRYDPPGGRYELLRVPGLPTPGATP